MTETDYEYRVIYRQKQLGGLAAGEYLHPCQSRDHALDVYAHYVALSHVTGARIERRPVSTWELFDLEQEAERVD